VPTLQQKSDGGRTSGNDFTERPHKKVSTCQNDSGARELWKGTLSSGLLSSAGEGGRPQSGLDLARKGKRKTPKKKAAASLEPARAVILPDQEGGEPGRGLLARKNGWHRKGLPSSYMWNGWFRGGWGEGGKRKRAAPEQPAGAKSVERVAACWLVDHVKVGGKAGV